MFQKIQKNNLTISILAGGKSRRMKERDKGLMKLNNKFVISKIILIARKFTNNINIIANKNLDSYVKFNVPVFTDILEDYQGPLSGIYTAIAKSDKKYLIVLPCDGPFIKAKFFEDMINFSTDQSILTIKTGDRLQPVYARFNCELKNNLEKFLKTNERKIDKWYNKCGFDVISYKKDDDMFINFNSPEDIDKNKNLINQYYG